MTGIDTPMEARPDAKVLRKPWSTQPVNPLLLSIASLLFDHPQNGVVLPRAGKKYATAGHGGFWISAKAVSGFQPMPGSAA